MTIDTDELSILGTLHLGSSIHPVAGTFNRFDMIVGTVRVSAMLWLPTSDDSRLLIATNGAVSRRDEIDPREVFQRRTWAEDIHASILYLSDPTLHPENSLSIAWGQGDRDGFALPAMAQVAQRIGAFLDIPSSRRLYFGSSAGGFQALQLAARDHGSRALVNNPQVDWTRYMERNVRSICRYTYGTDVIQEVRSQFPDRTHAVHAFAQHGYVPPIRYLLNAASGNDLRQQAKALLNGMGSIASLAAEPRIDIATYYDKKSGHMPLAKGRSLREINALLDTMGR